MGLLDFFQKGGNANGQGDDTTNPPVPDYAGIQQSYTNQSLANVSYPMASANPYAATTPAPVVPQANVTADQAQQYPGLQNLSMPQAPMAVAPTPVRDLMDPVPPMNLPQSENLPTMNQPVAAPTNAYVPPIQGMAPQPEEKDVPSYEYVDPSKHPVLPEVVPNKGHIETMPEGIKVTTYESDTVAPMPSMDNSQPVQEVAQPVVEMPAMESPAVPSLENNMATDPLQMPEQTNMQTNQLPVLEPILEQAPVMEPVQVPPMETPVESTMQIPPMDLNAMPTPVMDTPVAVDNFSNQQVETPSNVADVLPVTEVPVVETPAPEPVVDVNDNGLEIGVGVEDANGTDVSTPGNTATNALEGTAEVTGAVAEVVDSVMPTPVDDPMEAPLNLEASPAPVVEPTLETPVATEAETPVENPIVDVVEEVKPEEVKESVVETAPVAEPANFEMSYFKTVGFIGLNTQQPNLKVVEKVADLSSKLAEHAEVFILDSAKGYAKSIFDSAKAKDLELMGMYLKPFHSGYTDEAELGEYDNFTVMMFSNAADKVKNIIKESDILVMPEISGLSNLSILFNIWSTNSMYPGQNKPLILLGKGWTSILTQLKSLFKLTDADLAFVTVCQTTEEATTKIAELDRAFITKEVKAPKKIIDLREEDDEEGLFV